MYYYNSLVAIPAYIDEQLHKVIQAKTGISRLLGKVMYPLDARLEFEHVVNRAVHTYMVTPTLLATSTEPQYDVIKQCAPELGAEVIPDNESNVLNWFKHVVEQYSPDAVFRLTVGCLLTLPDFVDLFVD